MLLVQYRSDQKFRKINKFPRFLSTKKISCIQLTINLRQIKLILIRSIKSFNVFKGIRQLFMKWNSWKIIFWLATDLMKLFSGIQYQVNLYKSYNLGKMAAFLNQLILIRNTILLMIPSIRLINNNYLFQIKTSTRLNLSVLIWDKYFKFKNFNLDY